VIECFCATGGLGMFWFILWMVLTADCPTQDGGISHDEKEYIAGCLVVQTEGFNTGQVGQSLTIRCNAASRN
jgi:hypothetical protein